MANVTSTLVVQLLDNISGPAGKAAKALLGIGDAASKAGRLTMNDRLQRSIEQNNQALAGMQNRMIGAVGTAWALRNALQGAVGPAIAFESAMADVAKVSNFSADGLAAYSKELRKLATTEIPLSVTDLAALSAAASQSGVADSDLLAFTKMTAKTAVAWEMTGAAAGEALAKIKTQLGLTVSDTGLLADAINKLSDSTASSAPDMVDYTKRVAAQGEVFGFAAQQTLAFGAAMISAGAAPEVAATSFRNMGRALTRGGSATKAQRGAYHTLGLDAEDVSKKMQEDAMGTTMDVLQRMAALPEHMQASVMSDLFGDEARALSPLLNNLELISSALGHVANEMDYAGSVNVEFLRRSQTTEYVLQRLKNQVVDIGLSIGNSLLPAIKSTAEILGPMANHLSALAERFPGLTRAVVISTTGLIGLRIAVIGVQWAALMARGGLLSLLLPVVRLGTWAKNAATSAVALQGSLAAMSGLKFSGMARLATGLKGIATAIPIIGGALTAPVVAAIGAVAVGGALIYKYWDRLSSIFSGVGKALAEQFAPALEAARPVIDFFAPIGDVIAAGWERATTALSSFGSWIGSFFSREVLSEDAKKDFEQAGYDAANRMVEGIKNVLSDLVGWAKDLGSRIGNSISNGASSAWNWLKGQFGAGGAPLGDGTLSGSIAPGSDTLRLLQNYRNPQAHPSPTGDKHSAASNVNVHANFTISGATDGKTVAQEVLAVLQNTLAPSLRGVHADVGVS